MLPITEHFKSALELQSSQINTCIFTEFILTTSNEYNVIDKIRFLDEYQYQPDNDSLEILCDHGLLNYQVLTFFKEFIFPLDYAYNYALRYFYDDTCYEIIFKDIEWYKLKYTVHQLKNILDEVMTGLCYGCSRDYDCEGPSDCMIEKYNTVLNLIEK